MATARADRSGRGRGIIIVRICASALEHGRVKSILGVIGRSRRPLVIVPDGGACADAVGRMQAALGLSDAAARRMAMLALQQSAVALADMQPRLVPVETLAAVRQAMEAGRIPVWLPLRLSERDLSFPAAGAVASDALAAWLGEKVAAALVLLLVPQRVPRGVHPATLAANGTVNAAFSAIVERAGLAFRLLGQSEMPILAEIVGASAYRASCPHAARGATSRTRRGRRAGRATVGTGTRA